MKPYLAQIDELEKSVTELETTVAQLNSYTKRLGKLPWVVTLWNDILQRRS
jgi:hypothetical protein